jgi:hypothetical protein
MVALQMNFYVFLVLILGSLLLIGSGPLVLRTKAASE